MVAVAAAAAARPQCLDRCQRRDSARRRRQLLQRFFRGRRRRPRADGHGGGAAVALGSCDSTGHRRRTAWTGAGHVSGASPRWLSHESAQVGRRAGRSAGARCTDRYGAAIGRGAASICGGFGAEAAAPAASVAPAAAAASAAAASAAQHVDGLGAGLCRRRVAVRAGGRRERRCGGGRRRRHRRRRRRGGLRHHRHNGQAAWCGHI
mmetsp:Transcript_37942/g.112343  ORF Transcript_37942/g.112343 Transcript_37942/m.112343 type:complete len:207 (+) Transcript_37942:348-968(+)